MKLLLIIPALAMVIAACEPLDDEDLADSGFGGEGGSGGFSDEDNGFYEDSGFYEDAGFYEDTGAGGGVEDVCLDGCIAFDECGECFPDDGDGCLSVEACAQGCRDNQEEAIMTCLSELDTEVCDSAEIDACLEKGDEPVNECNEVCNFLDGCGECAVDDNNMCIPLEDCLADCDVPAEDVACLYALEACDKDAIIACFELDAGDDVCASMCRDLATCDICSLNDQGECAAVIECAELCRTDMNEEAAMCVANIATCDNVAINACLESE